MRTTLLGTAFLLCALGLSAESPKWTRVLSGSPVAGPLALGDRAVTVCDDRSVTCVDREGSFLWSRHVSGKPLPYAAVLPGNSLLAVSESGIYTLFSPDGNQLWRVSAGVVPLADPIPGRDGRVFIPFREGVLCVAANGLTLWKTSLPVPFAGVAGETGDGDLLLVCEGGLLFRISPFGSTLERIDLRETPVSLTPLPFGFASGFSSGRIEAWNVRDRSGKRGSDRVWTLDGGAAPRTLISHGGTLAILRSDGTAEGVNVTDGAGLWKLSLGSALPEDAQLRREYGQFVAVSRSFSCSLSDSGVLTWSLSYPESPSGVSIGSDGTLYAAGSGWQISAWPGERRLGALSASGRAEDTSYGILSGASEEVYWQAHPSVEEVASLFAQVGAALEAGTGKGGSLSDLVGPDEPRWARALAAIARNRSFSELSFPNVREGFYETERARAASLLGQLGSSEYRGFLAEESARSPGETYALGLLYGLAAGGSDRTGVVSDSVLRIAREAGSGNATVARAVCDALYALIRYSSGKAATEYVSLLAAYTREPYDQGVRKYARQVLGNIVQ